MTYEESRMDYLEKQLREKRAKLAVYARALRLIALWVMKRDGSNYERWEAMHIAQDALGMERSNELHQYGDW